jgi:hypothetical protein
VLPEIDAHSDPQLAERPLLDYPEVILVPRVQTPLGNGSSHGPSLARERSSRQFLVGGATFSVLGVMLALGGGSELAGLLYLLGLGTAVLGLHRFGRLGPG